MGADADNPTVKAEIQGERLQALYLMAIEVADLRDLQQVLDVALRHCLELTGSQFGFIGLNTIDGQGMDVVALQGYQASPRFYQQFHLLMPLRPPLLASAALHNRPVRSPDAKHDSRRVGQPRGHPRARAFLGVPLRLRGTPIGMIGVANRPGDYDEEHEHLLTMYASQVAIAVHNAQLYTQVRGIAIAEERARLAREMHDSVSQILAYINTQVEAVRTLLRTGQTKRAEEQLGQLAEAVRDAYTDVREDILALRTTDTTGDLLASLNAYLPLWQEKSGVRAEIVVSPAGKPLPPLSAAAQVQLLRIVQEALANVRKHAQAQRVQIRIRGDAGQVIVEVEDDGVGFDPTVRGQSASRRFGLTMMEERAAAVGGELEIDSVPGRGTHVRVRVPAEAIPRDAVGKD